METLRKTFAVDHRSVRLFRLMLGTGLILHAFFMSFAVSDFLTDSGLYPRSLMFSIRGGYELWTPLLLSGEAWLAYLWLVFIAVTGVLIITGKYVRLASVLAFLLVNLLMFRNPFIMYGSDKLLQVLCFWSAFLPAGTKNGENEFSDGISAAILAQIGVVYAVAGFSKDASHWWTQPVATYFALQGDAFVTEFGKWLTNFPTLLAISTRAVFAFERFGWILIFVTSHRGAWRMWAVAAFAVMHLTFGLALNLQLFPFFDIALLALALPPLFWEKIAKVPRYFQPRTYIPSRAGQLWINISEPIAMFTIALMALGSVTAMPKKPLRIPKAMEGAMLVTGLYQGWDLFAPWPFTDDGWYVFIGHSESGKVIDLFSGKEGGRRIDEPVYVAGRYPNYRWTGYMFRWRQPNPKINQRMGEFWCERTQQKTGEILNRVDVFFVRDPTVPPGIRSTKSTELWASVTCKDHLASMASTEP